MKYIKLFENYSDIESICEKYDLYNYSINEDGSIDVNGNVYLINKKLSKLPLKFRNIDGSFYCSGNKLTSLEGSPKEIGNDFSCGDNYLTSLEGCTKYIKDSFNCSGNKLTTLKYFPEVKFDIYINDNPLPKEIYKNEKHIKDIIKYQNEYKIWNYNDTLNTVRFNLMMGEIKSNQ